MARAMSRCSGCEACLTGRLPDFGNDDEEEGFWEILSPEQFARRPLVVKRRGRPVAAVKREKVTLMLFPKLKEKLEELARQKGVGYQTLIQEYLLDRVEEELRTTAVLESV